jgi:DNA-binding transcriptional regulator PaaX
MKHWLLLHYTLPANPSARRVYVWRKLKRVGAILLNESVWVLPDRPRTVEQFQWLTVEIQEMGGQAHVWRSSSFFEAQDDSLIGQFIELADAEYHKLLKDMNKKNPDMAELSRRYQQVSAGDYFHSEIGGQVRGKLLSRRGERS